MALSAADAERLGPEAACRLAACLKRLGIGRISHLDFLAGPAAGICGR